VAEPPSLFSEFVKNRSIYQESVPLAPGRYRLNVVAKDEIGGNMNNYEVALDVPHFDDERLASSSLILADTLEKLPTRSIGGAMFAIGDMKVRPRLGDKFLRCEGPGKPAGCDDKLGIYLQVYNFTPDEKTQKPAGTIEYEIDKAGANGEKVLNFSEDVTKLPNASANQVTIEKLLPLKTLQPGTYTLKIRAVDQKSNQTVLQQANFTVN
jgi:hypothetical protein